MTGNVEGYINVMKKCDLRHARLSMVSGETLEASLLGSDSVVLDVWYYCCAYVVYVVHVSYVMLCACSVVYI